MGLFSLQAGFLSATPVPQRAKANSECVTLFTCASQVSVQSERANQQAGTREKCFAFRSLGRFFGFLRGLAPGHLDEFSKEKYESDFLGKNRPAWEPFKKVAFLPCPSIEKHSKQRTWNLQSRSKYHFWGRRTTVHRR